MSALSKALATIPGWAEMDRSISAVDDAIRELPTVDLASERAGVVASTIDALLAGKADLTKLGGAWLDPDRRQAEVDAAQIALDSVRWTLTGRRDQVIGAGADHAIASLAGHLDDLVAKVPDDSATDEQVAYYDGIRRAQVYLCGGQGVLELRTVARVADVGCVDFPELIDPWLLADINGTERPEPSGMAPWPAEPWWPTHDRGEHLAWLCHLSPARPVVATLIEMRATDVRIREVVQAARASRASNRLQPRVVSERG